MFLEDSKKKIVMLGNLYTCCCLIITCCVRVLMTHQGATLHNKHTLTPQLPPPQQEESKSLIDE